MIDKFNMLLEELESFSDRSGPISARDLTLMMLRVNAKIENKPKDPFVACGFEVKYEKQELNRKEDKLLTPCKYVPDTKIGSFFCEGCSNFLSNDKEAQIVICKLYEEEK